MRRLMLGIVLILFAGFSVISVRNLSAANQPDISTNIVELVFSGIKGTSSSAKTVSVSNAGDVALQISSASIVGGNFTMVSPPNFPLTINPGTSHAFQIQFTPGSSTVGALSANLRFISNDPDEATFNFPLYGLSTNGWEGNNEPTLANVVLTLGYAFNVGWTNLATGTSTTLRGDEVNTPLFRKAGDGDVTITPVARYSPVLAIPFGYYMPNGSTPDKHLVGTLSGNSGQHQTLYPAIASGGTTFSVNNTDRFGIYVQGLQSRFTYSEDALNTGGPAIHAVRIYPLKNRQGVLVPNAFYVAFEDASNGDYQDYDFVLNNVQPSYNPYLSSPLPDQQAVMGQADTILNLHDYFADDQDADSSLVYSIVGNTNSSIAVASINGGNLTLDFNNVGSTSITVQAQDSNGNIETDVFTVTVSTAASGLYRINLGGPQITTSGVTWAADQYFTGGKTTTYPGEIAGTLDDELYITARSSTSNSLGFNYDLPIGSGSYTLNLYFAEIYWTAADKRKFDVKVEGATVISNLDIVAEGGVRTALIKSLSVNVTDGNLDIDFPPAAKDRPLIAGIEVIQNSLPPSETPSPTPSPTPSSTPPASSCGALIQEGESGIVSGAFSVMQDAAASGGAYVAATGSAANNYVEFCFTVPNAGNYRLLGIVRAPNSVSDSLFVEVSGQTYLWDLPISATYVSDYVSHRGGADPVVVSLPAGETIVRVVNRESGARLDKLTLEAVSPNPGSTCGALIQEGEAGKLSGAFSVMQDAAASGGAYVAATGSAANNYVEFCFTVPNGGNYRLLGVVRAPNSVSDSLFVEVSGQTYLWDIPISATYVSDYVSNRGGADPVVVSLPAGETLVRVINRESGARLDKLTLESNSGSARVALPPSSYDANPFYVWTSPASDLAIQQAQWVNIAFADEQNQVFADNWFAASDICLQCALVVPVDMLPISLSNGNYRWWFQTWSDDVYSDWSAEGTLLIEVPAPLTPTITSIDSSSGQVEINFLEDGNASWYQVYMGTIEGSEVHRLWYPTSEALCLEGGCTLMLEAYPVVGQYEVYMQAWGRGGFNVNNPDMWSSGEAFVLDLPAPQPAQNLSVMFKPDEAIFTWDHSYGATWYEIWIGSIDNTQTYHTAWYTADELGCVDMNVCSLFLPSESIQSSDINWTVRAWGPGG